VVAIRLLSGENLPGQNHHLTYPALKALPKIDLHRHLEGSLRLQTLAEIAQEHRIDLLTYDGESLRPYVQMTDERPSSKSFLAKFRVLRRFYQSQETISRLAYEAVADAAADNVRYLELRFSPQALSRVRGFTFSEVTDWVIEATTRASKDFNIQVGLIVTIVRHDPLKTARRAAEVAFDRHEKGIVGLDLAGDEVHYPMTPFRDLFIEAKRLGMGITIHAGEWSGAETVEEAIIDLGADRLGHGVRAVENSRTVKLVRERSVTLEICLTSNIQTAVVQDISHHPLVDLLDLNLLATLNTDDPCVSDSTLTDEYQVAVQELNLGYAALRQMTMNAAEAAFLPDDKRRELKAYFESQLGGSEQLAVNSW
jgi:adenosine deaminase